MRLTAAIQDELRRKEALLQHDSVKGWFASEMIRTTSTRRAYLKYLAMLVNHLNCAPDEPVDQRIADVAPRDFEA